MKEEQDGSTKDQLQLAQAPRAIYKVKEWLPYFERFEHEDYSATNVNYDPQTSKKISTI